MADAEATPAELADTERDSARSTPKSEQVQFALRQAALVTLALLLASLVTERLRPDSVVDRGLVGAIFWWAIVVWLVVLLLNAVAFERSQMTGLEGPPLIAAIVIGGASLLIGLIQLGFGAFAYVLAASLGTTMFWWGLLGLVLLLVRRVAS